MLTIGFKYQNLNNALTDWLDEKQKIVNDLPVEHQEAAFEEMYNETAEFIRDIVLSFGDDEAKRILKLVTEFVKEAQS